MTRADAAPSRSPVRRVAVLADDLTGAADAAAPFAVRGLRVAVTLTASPPVDADVLGLVTDTRWRAGSEATQRVRDAVRVARSWCPDLLFLKIDSTLRGRVREDVTAALHAWDGPAAAFGTPAFPGQGRVVRDGALVVHGETTVARVGDRFPEAVRVADAETDGDLLAVATRIVAAGAVAVGSGGLGRALAEVLAPASSPPSAPPAPASAVLVVAGTTHPVTLAQVETLVAAGAQHVVLRPARPEAVDAVVAALRAGRRVVVTCDVHPGPEPHLKPDTAEAVEVARTLATTVSQLVDAVPGVGLVLTGGATALAVATALGASELRVLSEAAEGLPLGELVVGDRRVPVVTKSGGFGQQDALGRAAQALEDRS